MIKSYAELDEFLQRLNPPKSGCVRVFRGQTATHPDMRPTGLRDGAKPASFAWNSYTQILARNLLLQTPGQKGPDDLDLFELWIHVIAQHYGPGTSYLDVSRSAEVALWFALNTHDWADVTHVMGPPGPLDPERDSVAVERWLRFRQSNSGFLFVFDVAKWDESGLPGHGQLVDLAEAPAIFASSERLQAQQACLIRADAEIKRGDLKQFYVCEPIPVGRPMTGAALMGSTVDALFPEPTRDHWYRRFLYLPFVNTLDYPAKSVGMARPWPVTVYMPATEVAMKQLMPISVRLSPLATNLGRFANWQLPLPDPALVPWANQQITAATPILLETPLLFATAPADSDQWNHGILAGDMSDSVEAIDFQSGQPAGPVDLRNVFLEFSLLENAGWESMEDPANKSDLLRALWFMRNHDQFVVYLVILSFPEQQQRVIGPLLYRLDSTGRRLQWWSPLSRDWADVDGSEMGSKLLFVTLTILRAVSPAAKVDPFPMFVAETSEGRTIIVSVRREAAQLVRVAGERGGNDWYALKEERSDAPFFFDTASEIGTVEFNNSVPWSELDPQHIRGAL